MEVPRLATLLTLTFLAPVVAGCIMPGSEIEGLCGDVVPQSSQETLRQAGSSTVLPVAEAWSEEFGLPCLNTNIVVEGGGTGAGFKKFCRGETDISDASRPIKSSERQDCVGAGIEPFEIQVAIDGLAVVVNKQNTWADDLTVAELNRIWTADSAKQADTWADLRPEWPDQKIVLFGPGTDSGTFDYFIEVIITPFDGADTKGRSDYAPSEDDNILVQGVQSNRYALGYFGVAYARSNADKVRTVPIDDEKADNGDGPFLPTDENVNGGLYVPLSRPIFMYTDGQPTGVLRDYFLLGLSPIGQGFVKDVGYIELPTATRLDMLAKIG